MVKGYKLVKKSYTECIHFNKRGNTLKLCTQEITFLVAVKIYLLRYQNCSIRVDFLFVQLHIIN
ncbi:hypothetical protein Mgra_00008936 [Meloidogyne graminicola]|uniref:Uncharacterized protein n=1 Tax=Meloidogyne graminicola TaxID=189291 RepID=A0A8S9ZEA7_9BILA|nr:hypothetical protein Mgra_00008936 [Meloidogyne graminicola]